LTISNGTLNAISLDAFPGSKVSLSAAMIESLGYLLEKEVKTYLMAQTRAVKSNRFRLDSIFDGEVPETVRFYSILIRFKKTI
jgi:hypothetical protein